MAESPSTPQTVLVTGASRGLGLEFVRQYAGRGDRIFAACRSPAEAGELNSVAEAHPGRLTVIALDVGDPGSIRRARDEVRRGAGALDLLINNAGIAAADGGRKNESLGDLSFESALALLRVNAVAPLLVAREFMELLRAAARPRLVSLSSGYGSVSSNGGDFPYAYSASKAALNMFMRSLAGEARGAGVTVVVLDPGWVKTDMGGPRAPLLPAQSVGGMLEVIDRLTPARNGAFLNYQGEDVPW